MCLSCFSLIIRLYFSSFFFFFNDTATTEIYTLSLHDALPIWLLPTPGELNEFLADRHSDKREQLVKRVLADHRRYAEGWLDRKSTRLNSSHSQISYAVFCLKKKKKRKNHK